VINTNTINNYIYLAQRAGRAVGTSRQSEMLGRLILSETLADETRQKLGYATYALSDRKQAGESASSLWQCIQSELGAVDGKPVELSDLADDKLGLLAFASGLCDDDRSVSKMIREYVQQIVRGRLWVGGAK
jgi:hypothetical protein